MTAALLQRILDAPDDDAPRLVYADWLLEHGDEARGELIQLQCKLAAEPDDARRRAMKIAENKLLAAHTDAWLAPIVALLPPRPLLFDPYEFAWSRGFLEGIRLTLASLPQLDELLALAPMLRALDVRPAIVGDGMRVELAVPALDGGLDQPALARFTSLALGLPGGGNQVAREVASAASLTNLRSLSINASVWGEMARMYPVAPEKLVLDDDGARELAMSPHLRGVRHLKLESNRLTIEGVAAIAAGAWRLETLDLGHNELATPGLVDALSGPALAGLTTLRLAGNALAVDEFAKLARGNVMPALVDLDLESCALGAPGTVAFCKHFARPALRRLRVERNSLGDTGAKAIAECAGLAALESFEAGHNRMGQKGGTALATSPHLAKLERLLLNEPRWKPEMTEVFATSATLANAKIYLKGKLVARAKAPKAPKARSER